MPIPVITNFDVNASAPIDSRMVVANSTDRTNIVYKYQGLKVFQTSDNTSWFWNGTTWSVEPNGIYGGSGSLSGNTEVYLGSFDELSGNTNKLSLTSKDGETLFSRVDQYIKWSGSELGFNGSQYIIEYNNGDGTPGPYIKMNIQDSNGAGGGIGFGVASGDTLKESLVLNGDGRVGINTNPSTDFQVGSSSSIYAPITINTGASSSLIGFNWFEYGNTTKKFNNSNSAAQLLLDPNNFYIRTTGTSSIDISTRFLISPTEIRFYGSARNDNSPGGESGASYKSLHNEFFGQVRSTRITKPSITNFNSSNPNYSFSDMTNGGLYLENTNISISNSGKKAFTIDNKLQNYRYFYSESVSESSSFVFTGSKGVISQQIGSLPNLQKIIISTFSVPRNLGPNQTPYDGTNKNGKIVIIEADLIGKVTKLIDFNYSYFRRYRFTNVYSINNTETITQLSSTYSVISSTSSLNPSVGLLGLSASISTQTPNVFALEYFFGCTTPPSEQNTVLSAIADYKVTVINDFAGDYPVVAGSLVISEIDPN
jgi:hypothetical protein